MRLGDILVTEKASVPEPYTKPTGISGRPLKKMAVASYLLLKKSKKTTAKRKSTKRKKK